MLVTMTTLLRAAAAAHYAIGAFNIYNLEGVRAVVHAAESHRSPVMLQVHPGALQHGGTPLIALCVEAARRATVPIGVHLDHSTSPPDMETALNAGMTSIMADGSPLSYPDNIAFTRRMALYAHAHHASVEAELGRLSGTEDGLTVPQYEACLTSPDQAADFVRQTGVDALAVCIGNVHGHYRREPRLDFDRLDAIHRAVEVPLVLHGASGLPEPVVQRAITLGVCKFNVNTEVREAYVNTLRDRLRSPEPPDLLALMQAAQAAMQSVVATKLHLFGSTNKG